MFKKNNGFSLIELMVVVGIMSIAILGLMTMMDNQNKDFKFLAEKNEILDTKSVLNSILNDTAYCGCLLSGQTFNTTTNLFNQPLLSVPSNYVSPGCTAGAQMLIPPAGSKLSASSNIVVGSLSISPATEIFPNSGKYMASLQVNFSNLLRSVKPISVPFFLKVDLASGTPSAHPFSNCINSAAASAPPPVEGFCTPRNDWDNSGNLNCASYPGYTFQKLTGRYGNPGIWRGSGCCYIPDTPGGNGWCSPDYPSWNGDFSGCGSGNANYSTFRVQGNKIGSYDQSICCFIPNFEPQRPKAFSTNMSLIADDGWTGCGGDTNYFYAIFQNTFTGGLGRNVSCTYVPK